MRLWEEIALSLLKKYTERYYTFRKREWELPHLEYRDLESDDPNFLGVKDAPDEGYYRILIDKSQEEIVAKLEELKAAHRKRRPQAWEFQGMKAIWFWHGTCTSRLLYLDSERRRDQPGAAQQGRAPVRRGPQGVPRRPCQPSSRAGSSTCCAT